MSVPNCTTATDATSKPQHINLAQKQRGQNVKKMDKDSDSTLMRIDNVAGGSMHSLPSPSLRLAELKGELKYPNHSHSAKRDEVFDLVSKHNLKSNLGFFWIQIAISIPEELRGDFLRLDARIKSSIREYINEFNRIVNTPAIEQDSSSEIPSLLNHIAGFKVGYEKKVY